MDTKNIIFAIILSTLVLVVWATFFEVPPVNQNLKNNNEKIIKKNDTSPSPSIEKTKPSSKVLRGEAIKSVERVSLENQNIKGSISLEGGVIDDITFKLFSRKFNTSYAKSLFEEQKELLKNYIHSFTDNGVELKIYLNEEVGRLKQKVKDSLETEEVKNDKDMLQKTKKIITILEDFKTEQIDKEMISKVLKVQDLVREIESDG